MFADRKGNSPHVAPWGPSTFSFFGTGSATFRVRNGRASRKQPPSQFDFQEFHLPEEDFGLLKAEKLQAKPLERLDADEPHIQEESAAREALAGTGPSPETGLPGLPLCHQERLSTSKLLLSPAAAACEGVSSPLPSQLPTPVFPWVGATPASQASVHSKRSSGTVGASPLQGKASPTCSGASALLRCSEEEKQGRAETSESRSGTSWRPEEVEAASFEAGPKPGGQSEERDEESPKQVKGEKPRERQPSLPQHPTCLFRFRAAKVSG